MIPRYRPTFGCFDAFDSLISHSRADLNRLQEAIGAILGRRHVLLFSSARVALYALLRAWDRPGGVVMPTYNCIVVPEAVSYAGYRPVFIDIGHQSVNMTPDQVEHALVAGVNVVLVTHQFGIPCEVGPIVEACRRRNVLVIEDAAVALGAEAGGRMAGTFGDAAIISFDVRKVVSGVSGGALVTDDDRLASRVSVALNTLRPGDSPPALFARALAWELATSPLLFGILVSIKELFRPEPLFEVVTPRLHMPGGFREQFSCFSATLVLRQLRHLKANIARRRHLAAIYTAELGGCAAISLPSIPANVSPAWLQFPVFVEDKLSFFRFMRARGIDLSWSFRYSCADSYGIQGLPNSRRAARSIISLPTYPSLRDEEALRICSAVRSYDALPKPIKRFSASGAR